MNIFITYGTGEGPTKLSAFDSALYNAGIPNYNLIYLSSIIPPHSKIVYKKIKLCNKNYGKKLYGVVSHAEIDKKREMRYIGLGWNYDKNIGGVFAESSSDNYNKLYSDIRKTLIFMGNKRGIKTNPVIKIIKIQCRNSPVSGVIAAVYKLESWS